MKKIINNEVRSAQESTPKMDIFGSSDNASETTEQGYRPRPRKLSKEERKANRLAQLSERDMHLESLRKDFKFVGTAAKSFVEANVPEQDIESVINCFKKVAVESQGYYIDTKGVTIVSDVPVQYRAVVAKLCMFKTLDLYTKSSADNITKNPRNTLWVQAQLMFNQIVRHLNK